MKINILKYSQAKLCDHTYQPPRSAETFHGIECPTALAKTRGRPAPHHPSELQDHQRSKLQDPPSDFPASPRKSQLGKSKAH